MTLNFKSLADKREKFLIRKLSIGLISVAVGLICISVIDILQMLSDTDHNHTVYAATNYDSVTVVNHYDYDTVYEADSNITKGSRTVFRDGQRGRQEIFVSYNSSSSPAYVLGDDLSNANGIIYRPYEIISDDRHRAKDEHERSHYVSDVHIPFVETVTHKKILVDNDAQDVVYKDDGTVVLPDHITSKVNVDDYTGSPSKYYFYHSSTNDTDSVSKIIKVGNVETGQVTITPITDKYKVNSDLDYGVRNTTYWGLEGSASDVTTYEVNPTTGELTNPVTVRHSRPMLNRIIEVGTKPSVEYLKVGNDVVKRTTTYTVNTETGGVTPNSNDEIIKLDGAKDKVVTETLASPVRFEKDDQRARGEEDVRTEGKTGTKVTTATYEVNPNTGEVIPTVHEPVITPATETVVKVAAKDKVVYSKDGNKVVKTTTTYTVDPTNGNVTETSAKETISEDGAKDKVVFSKDGNKVVKTTTTYTVDPTNGNVTETSAKETISEDGAKDKVVFSKENGDLIEHVTKYDVDPATGDITATTTDKLLSSVGKDDVSTVEIPEYTDSIDGNGLDGEGNTIPAPTVEITEYDGPMNSNDSDGEGNAITPPTAEIPEYDGPMNSNDSDGEGNTIAPPAVEIPEYAGRIGMNPDDAPVHELPELEIPDESSSPIDPIAPILPHVTDHHRTDEVPSTTHQNDVPSIETPMHEQNVGSNDQTYVGKSTTAQLPNTGTANSSSMLVAGLASAMSAAVLMFAGFKRKKDN